MKHVVIGTAGHIDHGKTALIQALTGRNTDRLAEEQRRGITIDLGFTWFDLPDGTRCGIVDVPGHEKFISNMAAGAAGMDLVLMVIAADEGIMPQTREHMDILELLGIQKAILVISKCDLAERDLLDMMEKEIREGLRDTILEKAPAVRVSSVTGEGIPELKALIRRMVKSEISPRDIHSIPRLPIDRVFTLTGVGVIVTGTLISGVLAKTDDLEVYPSGKQCKIRGIQVHGVSQEHCEAGQRVALNLTGVHRLDVRRGDCLAPPGSMSPTARVDVRLRVLPGAGRIIRNRERLHLLTGTSEVLCRALLLDREDLGPGEEGLAQLILEKELTVKRGDRFVVRFYSPLETIGGGEVLESNPGKKKRFQEQVIRELRRKESGGLADIAELRIRESWDSMITLTELARAEGYAKEELLPVLKELEADGLIETYAMTREVYCWHNDAAFSVRQGIINALREFYSTSPYRWGINKAAIHHTFLRRVKTSVYDEIIRRMVEKGFLSLHSEFLMPGNYRIPHDARYQAIEKLLVDSFETAGYEMLRFSEIDTKGWPETLVLDVLQLLLEEGRCVQVGETLKLYTMKHFMDSVRDRVLEHFKREDILTIRQVKEMCHTSRKCARLIVEYLDSIHVTKKVGAETERVLYQ